MAIYAVGDIQGCFDSFLALLDQIQFDKTQDTLWLTGDLVNRGPKSLDVLRFIQSLGKHCRVVLGNHDLHLLAVAYGVQTLHPHDTLTDVLNAPDRDEVIDWLRVQPLFFYHDESQFAMAHAGLAPMWDVQKALLLSHEVETVLQSDTPQAYLEGMYGHVPCRWEDGLSGIARLRCITNYFTRMRLCHEDGMLDLAYNGKIQDAPKDLVPWFDVKNRVNKEIKIIFGHWAALGGQADVANVYPLDTGCVWGHCLTAMRLSDEKQFKVKCK